MLDEPLAALVDRERLQIERDRGVYDVGIIDVGQRRQIVFGRRPYKDWSHVAAAAKPTVWPWTAAPLRSPWPPRPLERLRSDRACLRAAVPPRSIPARPGAASRRRRDRA